MRSVRTDRRSTGATTAAIAAFAVFVVANGLAACGSSASNEATSVSSSGVSTAAGVTPLADAPDALRFTAPLVPRSGAARSESLDATSFVGTPVAFWFWAPG